MCRAAYRGAPLLSFWTASLRGGMSGPLSCDRAATVSEAALRVTLWPGSRRSWVGPRASGPNACENGAEPRSLSGDRSAQALEPRVTRKHIRACTCLTYGVWLRTKVR
jgi:hypothetical protein